MNAVEMWRVSGIYTHMLLKLMEIKKQARLEIFIGSFTNTISPLG